MGCRRLLGRVLVFGALATGAACARFDAAPGSGASDAGSDAATATHDEAGTNFCDQALYCETFDARARVADLNVGTATLSGHADDMTLTATLGDPARALQIVPNTAGASSTYEARVIYAHSGFPATSMRLQFDVVIDGGRGFRIGGFAFIQDPQPGSATCELSVESNGDLFVNVPSGPIDLGPMPTGPHTIVLEIHADTGDGTVVVDGQAPWKLSRAAPATATTFQAWYGAYGQGGAWQPGTLTYDNVALRAL